MGIIVNAIRSGNMYQVRGGSAKEVGVRVLLKDGTTGLMNGMGENLIGHMGYGLISCSVPSDCSYLRQGIA